MAEKEYIERKAIINKIVNTPTVPSRQCYEGNFVYADGVSDRQNEIINYINEQPTADVAPVRHVTNRAKYFGETLCPNCGIHLDETTIISKDENEDGDIIHYEFQPNFCANCGAKMDGDSNADKT